MTAPFGTPVLKDGLLYGLSGGYYFCLDAKTGKTMWTGNKGQGQARLRHPGGRRPGPDWPDQRLGVDRF